MSSDCRCDDVATSDSSRQSKYPMINVNNALNIVIYNVKSSIETSNRYSNNIESISLYNALSRIIAHDIHSPIDLPPFPASVVDGYAIYISDNSTTSIDSQYTVIGNITAGNAELINTKLQHNQCVYITTGSVVPSSANCVIMIENTKLINDNNPHIIQINDNNVSIGMNIRPTGCDLKTNDLVLKQYDTIKSIDIGLLASIGYNNIDVIQQCKVGIYSSGNEIIDINDRNQNLSQTGYIYDSNRPMLYTAIQEQNAIPVDLGIARDNEQDIYNMIQSSMNNNIDILISSGGVSMGNLDLIKPMLEKQGTIHFGRINMKPGKPLTYATIKYNNNNRTLHIFALPGNPVSSLVTFYLFVVPAIKLLHGQYNTVDQYNHGSIWIKCKVHTTLKRDSIRPEYHRCIITYDNNTNEYTAITTGNQMSSRLMSLKYANGLLLIEPGNTKVEQNTICSALLIGQIGAAQSIDVKQVVNTSSSSTHHVHSHNHNHDHHSHSHKQEQNQHKHSELLSSTIQLSSHQTPLSNDKFTINVCVITISDSCSAGHNIDKSGPLLCKLLLDYNDKLRIAQYNISQQIVIPDDKQTISDTLIQYCDQPIHNIQLILTTGGM